LGALIRPGPFYLPFGLIAPLALAGMVLSWRWRNPSAGLLVLFVFSYLASVIPFFVTARFRLPVVPFLLPFAGFALVSIFRRRPAAHPVAKRALAVFLILVFGLLVNLNPAGYPLPSQATSHVSMGHLYLEKGRFQLAEREFQRAMSLEAGRARLSSPHLHALTGLAQVYAQTGRVEPAIDMIQEAASRWPRRAELHFQLGHLFYLQGHLDRAIDSWRRTIDLNPAFHQAYLELGIAYEDMGQYDRAVQAYQRAIEIDSDYVLARYNLSLLWTRLGQLTQAADQYRAVINTDPQFADAHAGLAWIFSQQGGRWDEGLELIERAIGLQPEKSWYRDVQAQLYIGTGQPDMAGEIYREMIRREPENPYWRERLESVGRR
jgi:tetratricopeptide (TPR) repeat protein